MKIMSAVSEIELNVISVFTTPMLAWCRHRSFNALYIESVFFLISLYFQYKFILEIFSLTQSDLAGSPRPREL